MLELEAIKMVRINEEKKEADAVTSRYFMSSIKSWYNKKGIKMGVEKVSNLYPNKNDKKKRGVAVTFSILDDMPKCRSRVIDNKGNVVRVEDETTGEERDKIEIISDPDTVTFFFNVRLEDEELNEFSVNPKASCFPLFNWAFMKNEDLPDGNTKGFICNIEELQYALESQEFMGTVKEESFQGGKPYMVLIPVDIVDEEVIA